MPKKPASPTTPKRKTTKSTAKKVKKVDNASYFSTVLFIVLGLALAVIILMNMDPLIY